MDLIDWCNTFEPQIKVIFMEEFVRKAYDMMEQETADKLLISLLRLYVFDEQPTFEVEEYQKLLYNLATDYVKAFGISMYEQEGDNDV